MTTPTPSEAADFVTALRPRLVGSLTLYCGDRATAEDLAQEALIRTWQRWKKVRMMHSPEAWTFRTAFNLANSWGRRKQAERRAMRRLESGAVPPPSPEPADAIAVRQAVGSLPARQRAAIVCRYYSGLSVEQTAEAIDAAPGTVKALTSQGIDSLRGRGLTEERIDV
ncbi:MAG: SigE family RNA polymerase sigma factor [Actinomycetota bacterium]